MFGSSLPPVCLYCPVRSAMISAYTRCSVLLYLQFVCIVLLCPLRFQHTHDVRFVFTSSLLVLSYYVRYDISMHTMFGSSLPPVVCRRSHVLFTLFVSACAWWCPAHSALCFTLSCAPYVTSFSGLSSSCVLCTLCYQFLKIIADLTGQYKQTGGKDEPNIVCMLKS
jgi:hypothetical protein